MKHEVSARLDGLAHARAALAAPASRSVVWVVSVSAGTANVYARVNGVPGAGGRPSFNGTFPIWRLEPEVGMQLETLTHECDGDPAVEFRLARLICGLLNVAKAGGRFDQLVIVGAETTRHHLRNYLNGMVRSAIVAELEDVAGNCPSALRFALRENVPSLFS